jgi:hypothetical protein
MGLRHGSATGYDMAIERPTAGIGDIQHTSTETFKGRDVYLCLKLHKPGCKCSWQQRTAFLATPPVISGIC